MRQIKQLYRRYQSYIFSGCLFTISALVLVVGLLPAIEKTKNIWVSVKYLRENVRLLSGKAAQLDRIDEQVLSKQFADLVSAVPIDKSLQSIFLTSDLLLSQSGLSISSIILQSPGSIASGSGTGQNKQDKTTGASKLTFTIIGKGSYDQVKAMLQSVHAIRRLVNLKKIDISFNKSDSANVQMEVEAYYKPLSGARPLVESPLSSISNEDQLVMTKISSYPWLSQPFANVSSRINSQGKADPFAP